MQEDISYVVYCPVENTNYNWSDFFKLTFCCEDIPLHNILSDTSMYLLSDFLEYNSESIEKYFDTSIEDAEFSDSFTHNNSYVDLYYNHDSCKWYSNNLELYVEFYIEREGNTVEIYADYTACSDSPNEFAYEGSIDLSIDLGEDAAITKFITHESYSFNESSPLYLGDILSDITPYYLEDIYYLEGMLSDITYCVFDNYIDSASIEKAYFNTNVKDAYFSQKLFYDCSHNTANPINLNYVNDIYTYLELDLSRDNCSNNMFNLFGRYSMGINSWQSSLYGEFEIFHDLDLGDITFDVCIYLW